MKKFACGIDFGTTNSTIGVVVNDCISMIKAEQDQIPTPSVLFFEENKKFPIFGQAAIDKYTNGEEGRFIRSIKRILGTDLMEKFTVINGQGRRFDELIYLFLSNLKKRAEDTVQNEISSAVIGRPVHFQDDDKNADMLAEDKLRQIAISVGFKDIVFQHEPIAAAFSHERHLKNEQLALVVDLGGGTSDFTIIRIGPKAASKMNREDDILSTSGIRIGGNDFDKALSMSSFMPSFGKGTTYGGKHLLCPMYLFTQLAEWSQINFAYKKENIDIIQRILYDSDEPIKIQRLLDLIEFQEAHRLLKVVEDTKISLTQKNEVSSLFNSFRETIFFNANKTSFEEAIKRDISKIEKSMKECLNLAGLSPNKINLLILTGGSCEIPCIRQTFKNLFPNATFSEKEKLLSVGVGLTEMARKIF